MADSRRSLRLVVELLATLLAGLQHSRSSRGCGAVLDLGGSREDPDADTEERGRNWRSRSAWHLRVLGRMLRRARLRLFAEGRPAPSLDQDDALALGAMLTPALTEDPSGKIRDRNAYGWELAPIAAEFSIGGAVRLLGAAHGAGILEAARDSNVDDVADIKHVLDGETDGPVRRAESSLRMLGNALARSDAGPGKSEDVREVAERMEGPGLPTRPPPRRRKSGESAPIVAEYLIENAHRLPSIGDVVRGTSVRKSTVADQKPWKVYKPLRDHGSEPEEIRDRLQPFLDSEEELRRLISEQRRDAAPRRPNRRPTREHESE